MDKSMELAYQLMEAIRQTDEWERIWMEYPGVVEAKAKLAGFSFAAVKRAKQELKAEKAVKYFHTGGPKDRVWHTQALTDPDSGDFEELPDDTETPFDNPSPSDL